MVNDKDVKEIAVRAVKAALLSQIDELIFQLKRLNPGPFGNTNQLLAHAEIEALNLVKDMVDNLKVK